MPKKTAPWMPRPERGKVFELGGLKAVATTTAQAKELWVETASILLQADYHPVVIIYRGMVGVAWGAPLEGTTYRIFWENRNSNGRVGDGFAVADPDQDIETAGRRMRWHMATAGHTVGEVECSLFDGDPVQQREFRSWARWQNTYAAEYQHLVEVAGWDEDKAAELARRYADNERFNLSQ